MHIKVHVVGLSLLLFFFIPSSVYAQVVINEVYPRPVGDSKDEFVELYNKGTETVLFKGWSIDDIENGGSQPKKFADDDRIDPKAFYVYKFKSFLNDTGDDVRLLNDKEERIDYYQFGKTDEGISYGRNPDGEGWGTLSSSSPGGANAPVVPTSTSIPSTPTPTIKPTPTDKPTSIPKPQATSTPKPQPTSTPKVQITPTPVPHISASSIKLVSSSKLSPIPSNTLVPTEDSRVGSVAGVLTTASEASITPEKKSSKEVVQKPILGFVFMGIGGVMFTLFIVHMLQKKIF